MEGPTVRVVMDFGRATDNSPCAAPGPVAPARNPPVAGSHTAGTLGEIPAGGIGI